MMKAESGDPDLYVHENTPFQASDYECRPYKNGGTESCLDLRLSGDSFYVTVYAYSGYANAEITYNQSR